MDTHEITLGLSMVQETQGQVSGFDSEYASKRHDPSTSGTEALPFRSTKAG